MVGAPFSLKILIFESQIIPLSHPISLHVTGFCLTDEIGSSLSLLKGLICKVVVILPNNTPDIMSEDFSIHIVMGGLTHTLTSLFLDRILPLTLAPVFFQLPTPNVLCPILLLPITQLFL